MIALIVLMKRRVVNLLPNFDGFELHLQGLFCLFLNAKTFLLDYSVTHSIKDLTRIGVNLPEKEKKNEKFS